MRREQQRLRVTAPPASSAPKATPSVLTFIPHYSPGYKLGGPVRSVEAWTHWLGREISIHVVCADRDYGERLPYGDVKRDTWVNRSDCRVLYVAPGELTPLRVRRLIEQLRPKAIYLNSFFAPRWTIVPLVARFLSSHKPNVVIAARGQLTSGATGKAWKKAPYLAALRSIGLLRSVTWQATNDVEAVDIRRAAGRKARVIVASNLRVPVTPIISRPEKSPGELKVAFLSRISWKKNLKYGLDLLAGCTGTVEFSIAGPVDDTKYWAACKAMIADLPDHVHVRYFGSIEHHRVSSFFASHHLLLLPTQFENYGHVVLEALEVGCPVLISDRTPWRGIRQRNAGWDIPLGDPDAYVAALEECIWMGPRQYRRMAASAMEAAADLADTDRAVAANRSLFGITAT